MKLASVSFRDHKLGWLGALGSIFLVMTALGIHKWWDSFIFRSSPVGGVAGVILHDKWRTQPGVNVIINGSHDDCYIQTLEGNTLAELPGGFCLFLPAGEYFSVGEAVNLYDREFKLKWSRKDLFSTMRPYMTLPETSFG